VFRGQAIGGLGRLGESCASGRVTLWSLDLVELVIHHAGFPTLCSPFTWLRSGTPTTARKLLAAAGAAPMERWRRQTSQRTNSGPWVWRNAPKL
jgi:hypothetical protein